MQPLDVGIFQPYKHWHDKAIQIAKAGQGVEYGLISFLRDLTSIQEKTFKRSTIKSAFKRSGMWPPNFKECLKNLKTFDTGKDEEKDQASEETPEPQLPPHERHPMTPKKAADSVKAYQQFQQENRHKMSSPTKERLETLVKGIEELTARFCLL